MKKILRKTAAGILAATLLTLTACSQSSSNPSSGASGAASSETTSASTTSTGTSSTGTGSYSGTVSTIPVGVCSTAKPDAYIDDSGKLTGFDVEALRAIDDLLPQYKFDLQTMEFAEILNGLSTDKVLMGSQQFEWNKERAASYLFGTVPLLGYHTYIVTLKDPQYDNVTGFKDLVGKSALVSQGGSVEAEVNTWNAAHPDQKIKSVISGGNPDESVSDLKNKVVDFEIFTEQDYNYMVQNYKITNWELHKNALVYDSDSFILFGKTQTQLQKDVDGALQRLTDNGTLAKLSTQFLGGDYTVKPGSTSSASSASSAG